ncbi:LuxR C-terminal-related transcriptional regulator [Prauserella cavernicola]|uniref:Tetratricopeptide repeat protein n=1 Tax=Prauserella cavernicola TaxID=2800127 RepID=A0A934QV42_9PSEU|nr:LuxR C-terminal-related transcriptional regulator [Prauserella cavernicola]MBK1787025.1 tetratricopeptide repeat protein [Prauserella cavernicola]
MPDAQLGDGRRRVPRVKLTVPEAPPLLVSRPRLLMLLSHAGDTVATLVCAPAGSGKTYLLADWARRTGVGVTAWVSLDADDNEDRRFWTAVLESLARCPAVPADSSLRSLSAPLRPSADPGFLAEVLNALDELPVPVWLVLDDVHEVTDPQPLRGLATLLRHPPAGLRLVLASRYDPPLPLARLRLQDQLTEIRAHELRFSLDEARALLESADVDLSAAQRRRLVEQTEGWAAGLRLAATSLSRAEDPDRFLAGFAENDRAMAEYLVDEVLSHLPGDLREFLRTISVCDRVTVGLAGALSGRSDAGALLEHLDRQLALAVRVGSDRRWYRLHTLVRTHLLGDLRRRSPALAQELHGIAADWFEGNGAPVLALAHATRAHGEARILALLRRDAVGLALAGEHEALRRALAALGERTVVRRGPASLVSALLELEKGDLAAARSYDTEPDRDPGLEPLRALVRSRRAQLSGDAEALARADDHLDPGREPELAAFASSHQGAVLLARGRTDEARAHVRTALEQAREAGQDYVVTQCLTQLAAIAATGGDYRAMDRFAAEADGRTVARRWEETVPGVTACVLLAYGALLRADPRDCVHHAGRAEQLVATRSVAGETSPCGLAETLLGAGEFELGERAGGLRRMGAARLAAPAGALPAERVALCAVLEQRAALLLGWTEAARDVVLWCQEPLAGHGELALLRARAQLALGRHDAATQLLRPLVEERVALALPWSGVEARVVEAGIALHAGEPVRARKALERALALAESLGVGFPLVSAGPDVVELLTRLLGRLGAAQGFAEHVLATRRALRTAPVSAPLTERERSVLRLLPTLRSFDEIAEDLTVSPNTVKTHVRAIYTKLGVRRRRDAVAVAVERGLLEVAGDPLWMVDPNGG